jgi:hypothetical protein
MEKYYRNPAAIAQLNLEYKLVCSKLEETNQLIYKITQLIKIDNTCDPMLDETLECAIKYKQQLLKWLKNKRLYYK